MKPFDPLGVRRVPRLSRRLRRPSKIARAANALALVVMAYVVLAHFIYALRHPEQTQTQVLLNFWEAMAWR